MPKESNTWLEMWDKGAGNFIERILQLKTLETKILLPLTTTLNFFSKQSLLLLLFVLEYTPLVV